MPRSTIVFDAEDFFAWFHHREPPLHRSINWGERGVNCDKYMDTLRRFKSEVQQCSIDSMAE